MGARLKPLSRHADQPAVPTMPVVSTGVVPTIAEPNVRDAIVEGISVEGSFATAAASPIVVPRRFTLRRLAATCGAVLGSLTAVLGVIGYGTQIISVRAGRLSNPADPYSAYFEMTNESIVTLNDVKTSCAYPGADIVVAAEWDQAKANGAVIPEFAKSVTREIYLPLGEGEGQADPPQYILVSPLAWQVFSGFSAYPNLGFEVDIRPKQTHATQICSTAFRMPEELRQPNQLLLTRIRFHVFGMKWPEFKRDFAFLLDGDASSGYSWLPTERSLRDHPELW